MPMDITDRVRFIFEFLTAIKEKSGPYGTFIFPLWIDIGFNEGQFNEENDIDMVWDTDLLRMNLSFGVDGNAGGYGEWKDLSHIFSRGWTGPIAAKSNQFILEELYRFFLPGLAQNLKRPMSEQDRLLREELKKN